MLNDLAYAYSMVFDYEKSIQLQTDAVGIFESEEDWVALANAYGEIGNFYHYSEDLDNAELYLKKAIGILKCHDDAKDYIAKYVKLMGNSDIDNPYSLKHVRQYIGFTKTKINSTLASIFMKEGKLSDAISITIENGKILKEIEAEPKASNYIILSWYYLQNNQISEAINSAKEAIELSKEGSHMTVNLAHSYGLLGECYKKNGDLQQAKKCYLLSLSHAKDIRFDGLIIAVSSSLILLYLDSSEYLKSRKIAFRDS